MVEERSRLVLGTASFSNRSTHLGDLSLGTRVRPDGDRIGDQDRPPSADEPDLQPITATRNHLSRVVPPVPNKRSAARQNTLSSGERGHVGAVDVHDRHVHLLGAPEQHAQPSPTILAAAVGFATGDEASFRRSVRVNAAALPTSSATASTIRAVRPMPGRMLLANCCGRPR